jgi:hypothetical protein
VTSRLLPSRPLFDESLIAEVVTALRRVVDELDGALRPVVAYHLGYVDAAGSR